VDGPGWVPDEVDLDVLDAGHVEDSAGGVGAEHVAHPAAWRGHGHVDLDAPGAERAGDLLYDGPLLDELDGSDVADYRATMARLRELPVTVVHAGHEPSFGRSRLVALCDAYLAQRR
jgi:hypothetical protein